MNARVNGSLCASRSRKRPVQKKAIFAPIVLEFVTWVTTSYQHRQTVLEEGREERDRARMAAEMPDEAETSRHLIDAMHTRRREHAVGQ